MTTVGISPAHGSLQPFGALCEGGSLAHLRYTQPHWLALHTWCSLAV